MTGEAPTDARSQIVAASSESGDCSLSTFAETSRESGQIRCRSIDRQPLRYCHSAERYPKGHQGRNHGVDGKEQNRGHDRCIIGPWLRCCPIVETGTQARQGTARSSVSRVSERLSYGTSNASNGDRGSVPPGSRSLRRALRLPQIARKWTVNMPCRKRSVAKEALEQETRAEASILGR